MAFDEEFSVLNDSLNIRLLQASDIFEKQCRLDFIFMKYG